MAGNIAHNLELVRRRMAAAAGRAGRSVDGVTLIGVTKTISAARIAEAAAAGLAEFGENRVQEAREKIPQIGAGPRWHLVGHLQGNKARHAARLFRVVHSIDSVDLLRRLDHAAQQEQQTIDGLIQVDLAGEASKFGIREDTLDGILESAADCRALRVRGLMALPPYDPDPQATRPYFCRLRRLLESAAPRHPALDLTELSMGMSEDFEVAIEEGATMIRVGRALFGDRPQAGGPG